MRSLVGRSLLALRGIRELFEKVLSYIAPVFFCEARAGTLTPKPQTL